MRQKIYFFPSLHLVCNNEIWFHARVERRHTVRAALDRMDQSKCRPKSNWEGVSTLEILPRFASVIWQRTMGKYVWRCGEPVEAYPKRLEVVIVVKDASRKYWLGWDWIKITTSTFKEYLHQSCLFSIKRFPVCLPRNSGSFGDVEMRNLNLMWTKKNKLWSVYRLWARFGWSELRRGLNAYVNAGLLRGAFWVKNNQNKQVSLASGTNYSLSFFFFFF